MAYDLQWGEIDLGRICHDLPFESIQQLVMMSKISFHRLEISTLVKSNRLFVFVIKIYILNLIECLKKYFRSIAFHTICIHDSRFTFFLPGCWFECECNAFFFGVD